MIKITTLTSNKHWTGLDDFLLTRESSSFSFDWKKRNPKTWEITNITYFVSIFYWYITLYNSYWAHQAKWYSIEIEWEKGEREEKKQAFTKEEARKILVKELEKREFKNTDTNSSTFLDNSSSFDSSSLWSDDFDSFDSKENSLLQLGDPVSCVEEFNWDFVEYPKVNLTESRFNSFLNSCTIYDKDNTPLFTFKEAFNVDFSKLSSKYLEVFWNVDSISFCNDIDNSYENRVRRIEVIRNIKEWDFHLWLFLQTEWGGIVLPIIKKTSNMSYIIIDLTKVEGYIWWGENLFRINI